MSEIWKVVALVLASLSLIAVAIDFASVGEVEKVSTRAMYQSGRALSDTESLKRAVSIGFEESFKRIEMVDQRIDQLDKRIDSAKQCNCDQNKPTTIEKPLPVKTEDKRLAPSKIRFFTRDGCPPCKQWESSEMNKLKNAGWDVSEIYAEDGPTPRFEITYRGSPTRKHVGYLTMQTLRKIIGVN